MDPHRVGDAAKHVRENVRILEELLSGRQSFMCSRGWWTVALRLLISAGVLLRSVVVSHNTVSRFGAGRVRHACGGRVRA